MNKIAFRILLAVGVIGLIIGSIGMWARFEYGHLYMAYGSYVPWGLWVAFDLIFMGLTAGAYIISVLTYGLGRRQFEGLGPLSVFTLLVSLLCEAIIISLDLGQPMKVYRFLITPNFTSMLTWLVIFILAMWINYLPLFYILLREKLVVWSREPNRIGRLIYSIMVLGSRQYSDADRGKDRSRARILAIINIPIGFAFFAVQGAFFAVLLNRPLWSSFLSPVIFMAATFLSGIALITSLAAFYNQDKDVVTALAKIVRAFLIAFLILEAAQFFIGYWTNTHGAVAALNMIAFGPNWWVFWIVHSFAGSLVPLYFLLFRAENIRSIAWACLLIVITFLAVRYNTVITDFAAYNLEGLNTAFIHPRLSQAYKPNIYEWLVSLWVVSLWLVTFLLGTRLLPVIPTKKGGE